MVVSHQLLYELQAVLLRQKFRRCRTEGEALEYVLWLREGATLAEEKGIRPVSRDPDDNYLLALAASSTADYLVSGDGDLLEIENPPTPVISPRDFFEKIRDQREAT